MLSDSSPRVFLEAEWRFLAMLNYKVEPRVLLPFVPMGTEIESWGGDAYVSVVGLMFCNTRVCGLAIPNHRNFEEVNLRFYVRRRTEEGWRSGVVFIRELVPRRMIAWVARIVYGERYSCATMKHDIDAKPCGRVRSIAYSWVCADNPGCLEMSLQDEPSAIKPNSDEAFITEHYWGYVATPNGQTIEYEVRHPRWHVCSARTARLHCDVESLYGAPFAEALNADPASAFFANGSPVEVFRGKRLST